MFGGACEAVGRKSFDRSCSLISICGVLSSGHVGVTIVGPERGVKGLAAARKAWCLVTVVWGRRGVESVTKWAR